MTLPVTLVALAGGLLALLRWRRHARASLLTLIACLLFLFVAIFFPALNAILPSMLSSEGVSARSYSTFFRMVGLVRYLAEAAAFALLLAAVFVGRGAQPNPAERNLA